MTDIHAVLDKATETIRGWAAESAAVLTPEAPPAPRIVVPAFPPPAQHITYPHPVDPNVLGATMGPMLSMPGVKDPIYFTVVEVDGNRVGLAYGLWKLP